MGKYLHLYDNFEDFAGNYIVDRPETIYSATPQTITITGASIMVWDSENEQGVVCGTTNNYNGTYSQVDINIGGNEIRVLYSDGTNTAEAGFVSNGNLDFTYHGMFLYIDGQDQYYQFNAAEELQVKVVVNYPEYREPWVSYTEENKSVTLSNGKTYKLKGRIIGWADSLHPIWS